METIPELKDFGEKNAAKYKLGQVQFICADGSEGYEKEAPYDKILCSAPVQPASAEASAGKKEIPKAWEKQLKINGKIVTPIGSSIWLLIKENENDFEETEYPGFAFVPLIEK